MNQSQRGSIFLLHPVIRVHVQSINKTFKKDISQSFHLKNTCAKPCNACLHKLNMLTQKFFHEISYTIDYKMPAKQCILRLLDEKSCKFLLACLLASSRAHSRERSFYEVHWVSYKACFKSLHLGKDTSRSGHPVESGITGAQLAWIRWDR